jgi:hypothetical protein
MSKSAKVVLRRVLINRDRWHSLIDVHLAPTSGGKADMLGDPSWADFVAKLF